MKESNWYVYMLSCADGSLYTGVTTDLDRRLKQHNDGIGAKYTRCRLPVTMVYSESVEDRQTALKREWAIKHLSRAQKLSIIKGAVD